MSKYWWERPQIHFVFLSAWFKPLEDKCWFFCVFGFLSIAWETWSFLNTYSLIEENEMKLDCIGNLNTIKLGHNRRRHFIKGWFSWLLEKYSNSEKREIKVGSPSICWKHVFIELLFCAWHHASFSPKFYLLATHGKILLTLFYRESRGSDKQSIAKWPGGKHLKQGKVSSQLSLSPCIPPTLATQPPAGAREDASACFHLFLFGFFCCIGWDALKMPIFNYSLQVSALKKHNLFSQSDQIENIIVCLNAN